MGKCHPDHMDDLLHDADNCSREEMDLIAVRVQDQTQVSAAGRNTEQKSSGFLANLIIKAKTMLAKTIFNFIARV